MAIVAEEHLFGLKEKIYETPYKNKPEDTAISGLTLISEKDIRYTMDLKRNEDVRALFMMTPYAYRTSSAGREKVLGMQSLLTDAHFKLLVYRKD